MDFDIPPAVRTYASAVHDLIDGTVIPAEAQFPTDLDSWSAVRGVLQQAAKQAGVFLPHMPAAWGGLGLDWRGCAVVFEEAGRSLLGPQALNCAAPDEGNMHLLAHAGNAEQQATYLAPMVEGRLRSCFCMTEPAPGAGSDPAMLQTSATRVDGGWQINGHKVFISGARGAGVAIVVARTGAMRARNGATLFLVNTSTPGFRVVREMPMVDTAMPGGHAEVMLEGCRVRDADVLGEVDKGFEYAQIRLGPARLTHCMRWLGAARRALEVAVDYAASRHSAGAALSDHQGVQFPLADCQIELHAARLMVWHAAWKLDRGEPARAETGMAKVFVAETVQRVIDRCQQVCGGYGVSDDGPLGRMARDVRAFRIFDGPSEVHRAAIGRRLFRDAARGPA